MASGNGNPVLSVVSEDDKASVRKKVWDYLETNDLVNFPRPCTNRIPHFKGAAEASDKAATLDVFKKAQTIKIHPDKPLEQARFKVLEANKRLVVPSPRLRHGLFNDVKPKDGMDKEALKSCVTAKGVRDYGKPLELSDKLNVQLVIAGSVAVSPSGVRLGKGEGFGDLEFAMAASIGAVSDDTKVVTIVHDCQVMDIPDELFDVDHDLPVDVIVTPTRVIECKPRSKPKGIVWSKISRERLKAIPVLRKLRAIERDNGKNTELMAVDFGGSGDRERRARSSETEGEDGRRGRRRRPVFELWIGRIPYRLRVSEFKAKVRESCSPIRVRWFGRRGYSYLTFQEESEAEDALKALGELSFEGRECVVQNAERRPGGRRIRREEGDSSPEQQDRRRRRASETEGDEPHPPRQSYRGRGRGGGRGRGRGGRMYRPRRNDYQAEGDGTEGGDRRRRRRPLRPALRITGLPESLRVSVFKKKIRETIESVQVIWRKRGEAQLLFESIDDAVKAEKKLAGLKFEESVCNLKVVEPPTQVNGAEQLADGMSKLSVQESSA